MDQDPRFDPAISPARLCPVLAACVAAIGSLVLIAWYLGIDVLKSIPRSPATMKPNTAAAFIASGASLWLIGRTRSGPRSRGAARAFAAVTVVAGAGSLAEFLISWNTGFDSILHDAGAAPGLTSSPARMSPVTALNFCLAGSALLLLMARGRLGRRISPHLAFAVMTVSFLTLVGYVYQAPALLDKTAVGQIAPNTAATFILLAAGLLLRTPDHGLVSLMFAPSAGGHMVRRLLPVAVLSPVVLGAAHLVGERLGWYSSAFGAAIMASLLTCGMGMLIWGYGRSLDRFESERGRAAEALAINEERLRLAIESASLGTWTWDVTTGQVEWSDRTRAIFGLPPDEPVSYERFLRSVHAEDRQGTHAAVQEAIRSCTDLETEFRAVTPEGQVRWVSSRGHAAYAPDGRPLRMQGIAIDITQRMAEKEALRAEMGYVKLLQLAAVAANEAASLEEACVRILEHICALKGFSAGHLLLRSEETPSVLISTGIWHLADAVRFDSMRRASEGVRIDASIGPAEEILSTGRPAWAASASELMAAPARAEAMREHGLESWLGFPILAGSEVVAVLEFFAPASRPDERFIETLDLVGRQLGLVVQRIRARKALSHYAIELERSNKELQEFALVASHDLQEPLRKVLTFAERIEAAAADQLNPQTLDYMHRMVGAARRMRSLVHNLLDLARVATRALPFEPTDLGAVVKEVLSDLEVRLKERDAQVVVGAMPTLKVDRSQMQQLLQNLLSNGLKFQPEGRRPRITVESRPLADGSLEIAVSDNGIGFDEKDADRIFKPFHTLHGRSEFEGNGMGLAICRKIVSRHGGEIRARSRPGEGSVFLVTLPSELRAAGVQAA